MQLFNFETILAIILLVFSVMTFWSNLQRKKNIGEKVIGTLTGLKYSDFTTQLILIFFLSSFTYLSYSYNTGKDLTLFYIIFPIALLLFITNSIYIAMIPKGFFKNGILTYSGILLYDEVRTYEMTQKKNTIKIRFNPKKSIFGSGPYLEIDPSQEAQIKAHLKKHCSFKKKNFTPPPRKRSR